MAIQIQGNNVVNPLHEGAAKPAASVGNPALRGMAKVQDSMGVVRKALHTMANAFRRIGESVRQANSGTPISMSISVKTLGIASNPNRSEPLNRAGAQNLKVHVAGLTPEKKQALVASAVKDVANGGHNVVKLLDRNPELFTVVVDFGGDSLLQAIDRHSDQIPTRLLSAVSDHMPKYIRDQCVTDGAYGALNADFDKGAKMISGFFGLGGISLHQALESVKALISSDIDGAMVQTGKEDMGEIFTGIREIVGIQGGAELKAGLAIREQFEAMSRPGEIAGGVLDALNSGSSLKDELFRDSVHQALTAVGISLEFTGDETHDAAVKGALKDISKQTGAGSGGDAMIFNRLTMPELKTLKEMASFPDGQAQIEERLNGYSGATPEAAATIATACMTVFLRPEKPPVSKSEVRALVRKLDRRLTLFRPIVNAFQKKLSPEQYAARKIDKLSRLVNNIQTEVNANRLKWDKETQRLAIEMVAQKLQQYIGALDAMSGTHSELQTTLLKQASQLLDKIDKVIVPASQFEDLTPVGNLTQIISPTIHDLSATRPQTLEIGNKKYAIGDLIGHGTFGNVYRCVDEKSGEKSVVKVMLLFDEIGTVEALGEVYTAQQFVGHRHIMAPSSVAITALDENEMRRLALVMPEADRGDLEHVLESLADKPLEERTLVLLKLLVDAADGLVEMHRKGFAHRDIKPGNIFVKTGVRDELIGMLGDLGAAQHESGFDALGMTGSPPYMPADDNVSLSVDSYAFGMMVFQLLSGGSFPVLQMPTGIGGNTPTMPDSAELRARIDAELPTASASLKSLIQTSLSAIPGERPTMSEWRDALQKAYKATPPS